MTDRYYHLVDKNEVLYFPVVEGSPEPPPTPDALDVNVVVLPPENPFWSPLPEYHEFTYDIDGKPNGIIRAISELAVAINDKLAEIESAYNIRSIALGYPIQLREVKFYHDIYLAGGGSNLNLDDLFQNSVAALGGILSVENLLILQDVIDFDPEIDILWVQ